MEGIDLAAALRSGAHIRTAGSNLSVDMDISEAKDVRALPDEVQRHLLRITQEAVTNAMKQAPRRTKCK